MKKSITIKQFQRLNEIEHIKDLEDGIEKRILTASALSGVSVTKLKAKPLGELTSFVNKTVNTYDFEFKDKSPKTSIVINGTKYYIVTEMHKIFAGQLMDLSTYAKDEDSIIVNLHYIVAILLRENKKEYKGEDLDSRAKIMQEHCPYNEIYQVAVFFCKVLSKLPNLLEVEKKKSLQIMSKGGDGLSI